MSIVVYTVILNRHDYLRPPEVVDPEARYLCYVDEPYPPCPPWEQVPAALLFSSGSRNSRLPKLLPHLHFDADYSVYHDANFCLKRSPRYLIERYLEPKGREMSMFIHPARGTVEQEANLIMAHPEWFPKENMDTVRGQVTRWKHTGAPMGLWAGGLILRKHTPEVAAFNLTWWHEFIRGSSRDQLALPVARHFAGMRIEDIEGDIYTNDLMAFNYHSAWTDKGDNQDQEAGAVNWRKRNPDVRLPAIDCAWRGRLEGLCLGARVA